jgi:nicotinamidase-related amidase
VIGVTRGRAALFVVDIQDRLLPAMPAEIVARVIKHTTILIEAAARLGLPVVVSQQYPKGLGTTAAPIEDALAAAKPVVHRFDKLEFSAAAAPGFAALAPKLGRDQWIVAGMETHVCVYQTVRDLVARGYQTHVAVDAVCSRTKANWKVGTGLIERAGGVLTSTEVCVFDLLERAGSEDFKALSKVIK